MKKDGIRAAMSEQVEKDTLKRIAQRTAQNRIDVWRDEWHLEPEPELDGQNSRVYESLVAHVAEALTTARREGREEAFKDAIGWAQKVHDVKLAAARDAQTDDEFAAMRLAHEADGAKRVVETLEAAKKGDTDAR